MSAVGERGYARGGGASGTDGASINDVAIDVKEFVITGGTETAIIDGRTAVGPNSDAMVALVVSSVLRHEHVDLDVVAGWCIGHCSPPPCAQVHSALNSALCTPRHSAAGVKLRMQSWRTNQPPANRGH